MRPSACINSVLLPIPGSPPMSVTEPATRPPPSTRSSSATSVGRCDAPAVVDLGDRHRARGRIAAAARAARAAARATGWRRLGDRAPRAALGAAAEPLRPTRSRRWRTRTAAVEQTFGSWADRSRGLRTTWQPSRTRSGRSHAGGAPIGRPCSRWATPLRRPGAGCARAPTPAAEEEQARRAAPAPPRCRTSRRGPSRCHRRRPARSCTLPVAASYVCVCPPGRCTTTDDVQRGLQLHRELRPATTRGRRPRRAGASASGASWTMSTDGERTSTTMLERVARAEPAAVAREASGSAGCRAGPRGRRPGAPSSA